MKDCPTCDGTGRVEDTERTVDTRLVLVKCQDCEGSGEVVCEDEDAEDEEGKVL